MTLTDTNVYWLPEPIPAWRVCVLRFDEHGRIRIGSWNTFLAARTDALIWKTPDPGAAQHYVPSKFDPPHSAPNRGCSQCGWHAFKATTTADDVTASNPLLTRWFPRIVNVMGASDVGWAASDLVIADVYLYGRVIEHELGYRAERLRVTGVRLYEDRKYSAVRQTPHAPPAGPSPVPAERVMSDLALWLEQGEGES